MRIQRLAPTRQPQPPSPPSMQRRTLFNRPAAANHIQTPHASYVRVCMCVFEQFVSAYHLFHRDRRCRRSRRLRLQSCNTISLSRLAPLERTIGCAVPPVPVMRCRRFVSALNVANSTLELTHCSYFAEFAPQQHVKFFAMITCNQP